MRSPMNSMVPFSGSMTPEMVFRMVVLPAPLAPRMVTMSASSTSRETPLMAMMGP